ncbi:MAG TPA: DUF302 domain-containing protein [Thiobacillaceae bacterium]|nr:DUF302 domain-containing protein [Thiobacillaceae bacterium]
MRIPVLILLAVTCLAQAADPPKPGGYTPPTKDPGKNPYLPEGTAGWISPVPTPYGPIILQQGLPPPRVDYGMNRIIPEEEKRRYLKLAMPLMANMMKADAREAMNYFAVKYKAKPGLSFDDVVESLKMRANQLNFKFVGSNPMWKDFKAVLGDDTAPRVEVFSFCDIAVARQLLKLIPEMIVFLPCRIAVMEDANKNIWVLTMDWDVTWLDYAGKAMGITPELRQSAEEIRVKMDDMMRSAANGDL